MTMGDDTSTSSSKQNSAGNLNDSSECSIHATNFWCPLCEAWIAHECGYDHTHAHMEQFSDASEGNRFYRNQDRKNEQSNP